MFAAKPKTFTNAPSNGERALEVGLERLRLELNDKRNVTTITTNEANEPEAQGPRACEQSQSACRSSCVSGCCNYEQSSNAEGAELEAQSISALTAEQGDLRTQLVAAEARIEELRSSLEMERKARKSTY